MVHLRDAHGKRQLLIPTIAQGISIVLFLCYGLSCFFSKRMVVEFERYRLARFRGMTGALQVAASLGILLGHFYSRPILVFSAGGLAVMMFLAVLTRFRIRDAVYLALPAFALCLLNAYIAVTGL